MSNHDPVVVLNALLRADLSSFIERSFATVSPGNTYHHNWHIDAIAYQLTRVEQGDIRRLIITMPPRSLKSIAASVAFPAWLLGRNPRMRILAVSYAEGLSEKLALDCLKVMEAPWYRTCFPATRIAKGRGGRSDFETTMGGGRFSTSIGGTLTGRGGDIILLDDPHKPEEAVSDHMRQKVLDWYRTTLLSRLNDPSSGPIVLIQQRVHEADLAGTLIEQGSWTLLELSAIAEEASEIDLGRRGKIRRLPGDLLDPKRLPNGILDEYRETMGSYAFAAQYQQQPAPLDGGLVKWSWFQTFGSPPRLDKGLIVQSWDTASKAEEANDYSVCTTWLVRGNKAWLLDVTRLRLEYPDLRKCILRLAKTHRARAVLIEDAGSGIQLIQDLKRSSNLSIIGCRSKDDKATRLMSVTPVIESGRVMIPDEAPWLAEFQRELLKFPNGKYDDQVDSLSQFLNWMSRKRKEPTFGVYG